MAVQFANAQMKIDPVTKLHHCTYTVSGNGTDADAVVAKGSGDDEYQAKRNAIMNYLNTYPKTILGLEEPTVAKATVTIW